MSVTQTQRDETDHAPSAKCWNCQAAVAGAHFCTACGKIQPLPAGTDYFAFFGLPEKLSLDATQLESEFHKLSWKLHPDNFVRATEFERDLSLHRSSELNDAYRTLRDPIARTEYLLELEGVKLEEQSRAATDEARAQGKEKQQVVPPDLLEEVFELNMQLEEMRIARASGEDDPELAKCLSGAKVKFEGLQTEVDGDLLAQWTAWDTGDDAARQTAQKTMVALLDRRRYLSNLVREVNETMGA